MGMTANARAREIMTNMGLASGKWDGLRQKITAAIRSAETEAEKRGAEQERKAINGYVANFAEVHTLDLRELLEAIRARGKELEKA